MVGAALLRWRTTPLAMASPRDPLDPLLDRWRNVQPPLPTHEALSHEVWRRIADAENAPGSSPFVTRLEATFGRPSFAFAFVAACTAFGLFLAEVHVSRQQAQRNVQLAHAYLKLIDPLVSESIASNTPISSSATP